MKEIVEKKINITPIATSRESCYASEKTFTAGNAVSNNKTCQMCQQNSNVASTNRATQCSEKCNCLIPFCCTFTIPDGYGVLTENANQKRVYYYSNLYYVVDTQPCTVSVSPPEGCLDLDMSIYPIKIVGSIPYEVNVCLNTNSMGYASDTGGTENFVRPSRANCINLTSTQSVVVNQVIGYVTDPTLSPVQNGQLIPTGDIEVSFLINSVSCSGSPQQESGCVNCDGNFKIVNCPLKDEIS
jgi:hypothetical protein